MALENLNQFHGSEHFYRHGMNRNFIYTDGVKYVAEDGGAYWLLDDIAIAVLFDPKLKAEGFQSWILKKNGNGNSAILSATDGNSKVLYTKSIAWTDFPLDEIKFFVVDALDFGANTSMIMLAGEY